MKAVDSNLLVYASLSDHPTMSVSEALISAHPEWLVNVVNLIEMHRVLISVYGVPPSDSNAKFDDFQKALTVVPLTTSIVKKALSLRSQHGIDLNDAILLETCLQEGVSAVATDDRALSTACASLGLSVENPIDDALRKEMADWEDQHLSPKGLPRVLLSVHRWLSQRDDDMANQFHSATQALSRLV